MSLNGKTDWRFKGLVDITGGKMTLKQVNREIIHYMTQYPIKRLIVDIKKEEPTEGKEGGYYTTIYLSKKDFKGDK